MARYVFVTGGVVSSLGKGLSSASLASLLQLRGYKVRVRKLDPYLNVDPGTMNPFQHGEVFVTDDGAETDLDIGHYERFTGISATQSDNITTGGIYSDIIKRERRGDYMKTKVAIYLSLVALLGAILFQNIDTISLQILLFEFQIPLVLLMVVMFALGALTYGLLDYFSVKKKR